MATDTIESAPAGPVSPAVEPYIAPETHLPEFTPRALILGTILGMVFGASSLYLVLKVGLTVSASIPVAVISLTLFKLASGLFGVRDATILENNIAQTAGSAGESIAFGVGVTMPAIMILGFDLELTRVMLVAVLGGALGILMMIPLRRALIVKEHGTLKYPEGTACAEVLKAGASEESRAAASESAKAEARAAAAAGLGQDIGAKMIFGGFGIGLAYNTLMKVFRGWKDIPEKVFGEPFRAGSVGMEITPELLGVGYIIGPRIASIMCGGGVLSYLVLIPLIKFFGEGLSVVLPPGGKLIHDMNPNDIRSAYILYIGAGAVAAGGVISLIRSLPTILHGLKGGLADFHLQRSGGSSGARTDQDLSMKFVAIGIVVLIAAIRLATPLHMNLIGALLIVVFGFLFVTVSSRLTGEIGSSSNPISGMTVATLLLTCLAFLLLGWTSKPYYVTALSVGAIVCIASSNGGSTSQDLKTGFLVGGTPRYQQMAILIGAFASALVLGPILMTLNDAKTVYVPVSKVAPGLRANTSELGKAESIRGIQAGDDAKSYRVWQKTDTEGGPAGKYLVDETGNAVWLVDPGINGAYRERPDGTRVETFTAPKATLMSYIIKGILDRKLPWGLVLLGVMIAITLEMSSIPALAFAVGVYLPLSSSAPIFVGGLIRWMVDRKQRAALKDSNLSEERLAAESDKSPGVLLSSGYIAGGAIAGIVIAFLAGFLEPVDKLFNAWAEKNNPFFAGTHADWLSLIPFLVLCVMLYRVGLTGVRQPGRTARLGAS
jgi:putative OPT family oligopeptide transporter